jgi:hypothetical protein
MNRRFNQVASRLLHSHQFVNDLNKNLFTPSPTKARNRSAVAGKSDELGNQGVVIPSAWA